ncbi:MAG TPA: transcriptional regulator [Ktedonobacteraceae bacterium]|nr:transcriptional regulator [Ktedonobacteraceae bacterium]
MASLNEIIHQPVRLRIMAILVTYDDETKPGFNYLKDLLELTDGNLGAHLRKLEEAGYITLSKTFINNKPHTYVGATCAGRTAFREHVAALEEILRASNNQGNS